MERTQTLKVGDKVYIRHMGSWDATYTPSTVTKVTPKGLVDVVVGADTKPRRFLITGNEQGCSWKYMNSLDTLPFDERTALLAQVERTKLAAAAINEVRADVRYNYGKTSLLKYVEQLEQAVAKARALTEAI